MDISLFLDLKILITIDSKSTEHFVITNSLWNFWRVRMAFYESSTQMLRKTASNYKVNLYMMMMILLFVLDIEHSPNLSNFIRHFCFKFYFYFYFVLHLLKEHDEEDEILKVIKRHKCPSHKDMCTPHNWMKPQIFTFNQKSNRNREC